MLLLSLALLMRRTRAATVIQKNQRMLVEKKRYRQKRAAALAVQTVLRAYMARQKYQAVGAPEGSAWPGAASWC